MTYDYHYVPDEGQYEISKGPGLVGTAARLADARLFAAAPDLKRTLNTVRDQLARSGPPYSEVAVECIDLIDEVLQRPRSMIVKRRKK